MKPYSKKSKAKSTILPLEAQLARDADETALPRRKHSGQVTRGFHGTRDLADEDGADDDDDAGDDMMHDYNNGKRSAALASAGVVPARQSRRILEVAHGQRLEDEEDDGFLGAGASKKRVRFDSGAWASGAPASSTSAAAALGQRRASNSGLSDAGNEDEDDEEIIEFEEEDGAWRLCFYTFMMRELRCRLYGNGGR